MKSMHVLGLIFLSMFSAASFSMDIKNGKLISHKEWSTGDIKGSFKDAVNKNSKTEYLRSHTNRHMRNEIAITNDINSTYNVAGEESIFSGQAQVVILNGDPLPHTYKIKNVVSICYMRAKEQCEFEDYVTSEDVVNLDSDGFIFFYKIPKVMKKFDSAGYGWARIETFVEKDNTSGVFSTARLSEFNIMDANV